MLKNKIRYLPFLIFILFEILLVTFGRGKWMGYHENGVLHLLVSISIGVLAIYYAFSHSDNPEKQITVSKKLYLIFALGAVVTFLFFLNEITNIPISPRESDIIPQIQTLNQRLLKGEFPYRPIQSFTAYMFPTYMPMMWLPFLIPQLLGFDERLLAFSIWLIAYFIFFKITIKTNMPLPTQILLSILPIFLFIGFAVANKGTFGHSIELMNAAFYIFLSLIIFKTNRAWLIGSAVALCLLSRYSLVLWVPLFLILLFKKDKNQAFKTGGWILFWLVIFYFLPFYLKDTSIFQKGIAYHNTAALDIWNRSQFSAGGLKEGLGVASLFCDFYPGEIPQRLAALQTVHKILSFTSVFACGILYTYYRARIHSFTLFALGSLKLYLAFFYGFIQAPYLYLFLVPCSVSIVLYLALNSTHQYPFSQSELGDSTEGV